MTYTWGNPGHPGKGFLGLRPCCSEGACKLWQPTRLKVGRGKWSENQSITRISRPCLYQHYQDPFLESDLGVTWSGSVRNVAEGRPSTWLLQWKQALGMPNIISTHRMDPIRKHLNQLGLGFSTGHKPQVRAGILTSPRLRALLVRGFLGGQMGCIYEIYALM